MHLITYLIILLGLVLSACGNDTVESMQNLHNSEFTEVMDKADQDNYEPPENGQLTEDQIKMYIAVKKREAELRKSEAEKVNKKIDKAEKADEESFSGMVQNLDAMQQMAGFLTLDIRAAQELNYNTAEYDWVKNALIDAHSNSMMGNMQDMQTSMNQGFEESIAQWEKMRDETKDPQQRAMFEQLIQETRQEIERMKQEADAEKEAMTPATKYNVALYNKHKDEINLLENELNKYDQIAK